MLNETVTKTEVKNIFGDELKSKEFEKAVREIAKKIIIKLYRNLYQKNNVLINDL